MYTFVGTFSSGPAFDNMWNNVTIPSDFDDDISTLTTSLSDFGEANYGEAKFIDPVDLLAKSDDSIGEERFKLFEEPEEPPIESQGQQPIVQSTDVLIEALLNCPFGDDDDNTTGPCPVIDDVTKPTNESIPSVLSFPSVYDDDVSILTDLKIEEWTSRLKTFIRLGVIRLVVGDDAAELPCC